ncbi:MAG: hypothetical protein RR806_05315 [Oscillospiraceae bacterium]
MLFNAIILLSFAVIIIVIFAFCVAEKNKSKKVCQNIHNNENDKCYMKEKRVNTILYNIDVYNGTESGQREVI